MQDLQQRNSELSASASLSVTTAATVPKFELEATRAKLQEVEKQVALCYACRCHASPFHPSSLPSAHVLALLFASVAALFTVAVLWLRAAHSPHYQHHDHHCVVKVEEFRRDLASRQSAVLTAQQQITAANIARSEAQAHEAQAKEIQ